MVGVTFADSPPKSQQASSDDNKSIRRQGSAVSSAASSNASTPASRRPFPPRLVQRNLPFKQSHSEVQVEHNQGWKIFFLVRYDMFHVLLRLPALLSVTAMLIVWTVAILIFAAFYYSVDRLDPYQPCGLGEPGYPLSYPGAFAFSLETCTTVGYGLPSSANSFFEQCPMLQVTIYFQMVWSMLFNAFLFSFFYARLATCDQRAVQVVFSEKAIVSVSENGQVRFQVRVYDVDARYPVVEAHVRMYAVMRVRPVPRPLRILQPNDDLGAALWLSMPTVVCHHIDLYSMLHPPVPAECKPTAGGLILRQCDSATANREEVDCPICSEGYATHERWVRHVRYQQIVERKDEFPVEGTHLSITEEDLVQRKRYAPITDLKKLSAYFEKNISEVICVVEGIDPLVSGTFQALQSYRFEDIVWSNLASFHPCVKVDGERVRVDLDRFHRVDLKPEQDAGQPGIRKHRDEDDPTERRSSLRTADSFVTSGYLDGRFRDNDEDEDDAEWLRGHPGVTVTNSKTLYKGTTATSNETTEIEFVKVEQQTEAEQRPPEEEENNV